jgi:hypothetical protein
MTIYLKSQNIRLPTAIASCLEYLLLFIPSLTIFALERYSENLAVNFHIPIFVSGIGLPILVSLFITSIKCRDSGARKTLSQCARIGFSVPIIFALCTVIATIMGWRKDDGSVGWFMVMAVPIGVIFAFVTSTVGMCMTLTINSAEKLIRKL